MNWWALVIGLLLYGWVMLDLFKTTLSLNGWGQMTNSLLRWYSKAYFKTRGRQVDGSGERNFGVFLILSLLFIWFFAQLISLTLILHTDPASIIDSQTQLPTSFAEKLYYTAISITTVGYGDYLPGSRGWRYFTIAMSASALISLSLAISYLIPVLQATIQKRATSSYISSLGGHPQYILQHGWNGSNFNELDPHFQQIATQVFTHSQQHKAYPIIHYLETGNREELFPANVAALDEALTLLFLHVPEENRDKLTYLYVLRNAITSYLDTLDGSYTDPAPEAPPMPDLQFLREMGISPVTYSRPIDQLPQFTGLDKRRRLLKALVQAEGREWDSIFAGHAYNESLDFNFERVHQLRQDRRKQTSMFDRK